LVFAFPKTGFPISKTGFPIFIPKSKSKSDFCFWITNFKNFLSDGIDTNYKLFAQAKYIIQEAIRVPKLRFGDIYLNQRFHGIVTKYLMTRNVSD